LTKGGARPGSGAPQRNLNALKHGRRSKAVKALILQAAEELRANPEVAAALRALQDALRHRRTPAA